jgi:uncharacterized protein YecE (DUF72 family)
VTPPDGKTVFYPSGTKQSEMLEMYSRIFETIEVDSTAYGVPRIEALEGWRQKTPEGFTFSLKVPNSVTHEFSLRPQSYPILDDMIRASEALGDKLGMILIQLPASFEANKENGVAFREFVRRLQGSKRFAVEFRDPGWFNDWTFDELNACGVALALVEGKWVEREIMFAAAAKVSSHSSYIRLMGIRDLEHFDRIYRERTDVLMRWAEIIIELDSRRQFVYIDNYFEGHAPATANRLRSMLGLTVADPATLEIQPSLF